MSWEGFMQMERRQLWERLQGKLCRALGVALLGESVEGLNQLGERDQLRVEQGLVPVIGKGNRIFYKHLEELSRVDMNFRIAAEWVEVAWLKERLACTKKDAAPPPSPIILAELPRTPSMRSAQD
jgi:hypothetical protein